jgi:hypothetical protein
MATRKEKTALCIIQTILLEDDYYDLDGDLTEELDFERFTFCQRAAPSPTR